MQPLLKFVVQLLSVCHHSNTLQVYLRLTRSLFASLHSRINVHFLLLMLLLLLPFTSLRLLRHLQCTLRHRLPTCLRSMHWHYTQSRPQPQPKPQPCCHPKPLT
jgi:hypothetical protein